MGFGRGKGFTVKTTPTEKVIELVWGKYILKVSPFKTAADYFVTNSIDLEETLDNPTYTVS